MLSFIFKEHTSIYKTLKILNSDIKALLLALLLIFQSSKNTHDYKIVLSASEEMDCSKIQQFCRILSKHNFFQVSSALLIVIVCTTVTKYITNQLFNLYKFKKHTLPRSDSYISLLYARELTVLNKSLSLQLKNRSYIQSRGYCLI